MYRRSLGAASCGVVGSVAEIGVNGASCYVGASNLIPALVPPLPDSRSFGNCRSAIVETGAKWTAPALEIALCQSGRPGRDGREPKPRSRGREPLSLRPRTPPAAPAQPRTGAPDAAGERGRSFGPGCEARAAPPPAARRSAPSPGDCSMVSAPTLSLSAVCRDSSDRGSRKRVCTIATRNKTSHSSAHGCGAL